MKFLREKLEEIFKNKKQFISLVKAKKFSIYYNYFSRFWRIFTILAPYQLIVDKNYL